MAPLLFTVSALALAVAVRNLYLSKRISDITGQFYLLKTDRDNFKAAYMKVMPARDGAGRFVKKSAATTALLQRERNAKQA